MKNILITILILLPCLYVNATTYYVSNTGSDAANGTSEATAWQTIDKVNSFPSFSAGDNIYFKRGDTFYGKLIISNSGSSGSPITYGTYGTGANPVITGFVTVSGWTDLGFNVWQSTNEVSTLPDCNMVLINNINIAMGRYPNTGWLTYQSSTATSITSSSLDASTMNWTGAQAVIKKERYIIDRPVITSASGSTINYTNPSWSSGHANWGFFIQNDTRTLDTLNEWYYNGSDKKISVYNIGAPTNVKLATRDTLVYIVNKSYITFDGLSFTGANGQAFYLGNASNLTIKNCTFDFNYNAIAGYQFGGSSSNLLIDSCTFNHTNNNAINLPSEFAGATITNNTIKNTGMISGLAASGQSRWGMNLTGTGYTVQYNKVDTTGYVAIGFNGSNMMCKNNVVDYFCAITDDGGGIYTGNPQTGVVISDNIVLNGIGNDEGTNGTNNGKAYGIYCDDNSSEMSILNNSVANMIDAGIFLHQVKDIIVRGNTTYNCRVGLFASNDNSDTSYHTTGLDVKHNIFVANTTGTLYSPQDQVALWLASMTDDLSNYGNIDSNYYARPIDDNLTIYWTIYGNNDWTYSLNTWQAFSGYDTHSNKSPKTITDVGDMRFEYNATASPITIELPYKYTDMQAVDYNTGSITLQPYSSVTLIKNGALITNYWKSKVRRKFINK